MDLTLLDFVNLGGSISSLILAIISIWLALYFYGKSKESELSTSSLLTKTEQEVFLMQKITARMLDKYVTHSTTPQPVDPLVAQLVNQIGNRTSEETTGLSQAGGHGGTPSQEQVDGFIATMYWSAIANAALQERLPDDIGRLEDTDNVSIKNLLQLSKNDYMFTKRWLEANGDSLIESSSAYDYYRQFQESSPESALRDAAEVYAYRAQQNFHPEQS